MRILHLASFSGNYGDVLNHCGFHRFLNEVFDNNYILFCEEIRDYYKKRNYKSFDEEFVSYVNQFDLLVIGGGNFLSPWLEESKTGTTFDIDLELFKKICCPILFCAVGCEMSLGYTEITLFRLEKLLRFILFGENKGKYFFSVRNDGSQNDILKFFGKNIYTEVNEVMDFAFNMLDNTTVSKKSKVTTCGIVFSTDRYKDMLGEKYDEFLSAYAIFLKKSIDSGTVEKLIFIPHTYYDIESIYQVINMLPDKVIRECVEVAPLLTQSGSEEIISKYYNKCDVVISGRFHGCIQALNMYVPVVALYADKRIDELMKSVNLSRYSVTCMDTERFNIIYDYLFTEYEQLYEESAEVIKNLAILRKQKLIDLEKWMHSLERDV